MVSCQVPGAYSVLLREGQVRREGAVTKHFILCLARVLLRLQGPVEKGEQSHPQGEVQ